MQLRQNGVAHVPKTLVGRLKSAGCFLGFQTTFKAACTQVSWVD
ncbi:hypothetical protein [Neisseria sicca]|nr:hypothetical protein [Neisseria sicca]